MNNIRRARSKDVPSILNLLNSSEFLVFDKDDAYTKTDVYSYINNRHGIALVYELNGSVVGVVYAEPEDKTSFFICRIVVDSAYRNRGIADNLISYLENYARKKNKKNIVTEMLVDSRNTTMRKFVEKRGYRAGNEYIYYKKSLY